jgi:hypothetical protein
MIARVTVGTTAAPTRSQGLADVHAHHPLRGRPARAGGTEESDQPGLHVEGQPGHGNGVAVFLYRSSYFDHG